MTVKLDARKAGTIFDAMREGTIVELNSRQARSSSFTKEGTSGLSFRGRPDRQLQRQTGTISIRGKCYHRSQPEEATTDYMGKPRPLTHSTQGRHDADPRKVRTTTYGRCDHHLQSQEGTMNNSNKRQA